MARILVVEDETVVAMLIEAWLSDIGHETIGPVGTVAAALSLLEKHKVDAAIVDLSLGGTRSYEIANALRQKAIPFAWGTGYSAKDIDPDYCNEPLIAKPYSFDDLTQTLALLIAEATPADTPGL